MKTSTQNETVKQRLEYLRGELRAERISYGELAELTDLKEHIAPGDVELLEAAGVREFPEAAGHTPGWWRIESSGTDGNTGFFKFKISSETGQEILETRVHVLGTTYDQIYANARLIAAAPELLSALRHVQTAMMSWQKNPEIRKAFNATCNECSFSCAAETIEVAIARAIGGEI